MTRSNLDLGLAWAREEGWNPGLDDAGPFYAQDPSGFLMGWLGDEPIACISVVKYSTDFAFLGLYIVRPEHRGKGYGKTIWDAGIASAGDRTIGLDGVVAQQDNYRKSGFILAHRSARWSGVIDGSEVKDRHVRTVSSADFDAITQLDRLGFPAARDRFLSSWLLEPSSRHSMCYVDNDRILGFGTIRPSVDGHKIGPLFAHTPQIAESLLRSLASYAENGPIVIDIPEPNAAATALVRHLAFTASFETARMYRGPVPDLHPDQTFGITTLELG